MASPTEAPIRITRVGGAGRAALVVAGTPYTLVCADPDRIAAAALAARPELAAVHRTGWSDPGSDVDLSSTIAARAIDRAAARASEAAGGAAVLVASRAAVAVTGPPPGGGWTIRTGGPDRSETHLRSGGMATCRGRAGTEWNTVTVVAATCAAAAATARAAIRMAPATGVPGWLEARGLAARLVGAGGRVVHTAPWARSAVAA